MRTVLILALLLLSACSAGLSPEEIQNKVIEANSNIDLYKISSEVSMITEANGNEINMEISMNGEIDRGSKLGHISSVTNMNLMGLDTSVEQESYFDENNIYMNSKSYFGSEETWIKMKLNVPWEQQDQAEQYADLIENGDMKIKGIEKIDGTNYYVVELSLDKEFLDKYAMSSGQELTDINFGDYDITFYINSETFIIERNVGTLTISEMLNGESVSMDMEIDSKIYDINEAINIEIPEEAYNAQELDAIGGE